MVRLPDGEELRGAARASDLDEHAVPGLPLLGRLVGERPQDHGPLEVARDIVGDEPNADPCPASLGNSEGAAPVVRSPVGRRIW